MGNSQQETYLGDKIDRNGKLKPTIESRISRGYGAISNILAIVNEIPLAHWRVEAGLHLRQAMLLNGTLFNSEAWQGMTISEILQLERVDERPSQGSFKGSHRSIVFRNRKHSDPVHYKKLKALISPQYLTERF